MPRNKSFKPVLQFDMNWNLLAEYQSQNEAAAKTGICTAMISDSVVGKRGHVKGYYFLMKLHYRKTKAEIKREIEARIPVEKKEKASQPAYIIQEQLEREYVENYKRILPIIDKEAREAQVKNRIPDDMDAYYSMA